MTKNNKKTVIAVTKMGPRELAYCRCSSPKQIKKSSHCVNCHFIFSPKEKMKNENN